MQYKQGWQRTTGLLIFMFLLDKVSTWFHVMKQQRWFTFLEHVDASGQTWAEQEWPPEDGTNRKKQKCRVQVCRSPVQILSPWSMAESEQLWSWWGRYPHSCWKEGLAPALVQKEETGLSFQWDNIIYCPHGAVDSLEKVSAGQTREKLPWPIIAVSCCAPQVTLIVWKGRPQEGVRKDNGFNL